METFTEGAMSKKHEVWINNKEQELLTETQPLKVIIMTRITILIQNDK